jgi:hypothetical protein
MFVAGEAATSFFSGGVVAATTGGGVCTFAATAAQVARDGSGLGAQSSGPLAAISSAVALSGGVASI